LSIFHYSEIIEDRGTRLKTNSPLIKKYDLAVVHDLFGMSWQELVMQVHREIAAIEQEADK
jgi:hypothetical protein